MTNGEARLRELVQRLDTIAAEIYKEGYEHTAGGSARGAQLNMLATEFAEALAAPVQAEEHKNLGVSVPFAASTEGPSLSTLGSHAQDVEYVPDDTQAPWAAGTGGAFDLPAKWRKLAEASEDKYNHNPDCVNEDFEPLRMCADELEVALAALREPVERRLLTKQECWEAWSASQIKGPVALTDWQMVADRLNALARREPSQEAERPQPR